MAHFRRLFIVCVLLGMAGRAVAGVLPEDRGDLLYHYYDGGGVKIDGPSVLVRKKVFKNFSLFGNYYVDTVSSASIDVVTTASPYDEERTEMTGGVDFLRGDTLMSLSVTNSEENDYTSDTYNFGISQDIFGGLTTVTMSYAYASNTVRQNGDDTFEEDMNRQNYRVGVSQVITRNMIMGLSFETVTDEGFINNPYRSVRFLNPDGVTYSYQPEVYPNTRTSNAVALRTRYHLPYRAVIHGGYRYFTDDWDIDAHTFEVGYTQPLGQAWTFDLGYRYYTQTAADFYSDLFPYEDAQNFMARDKELSTFVSHTIRFGASYDFLRGGWQFLERGSINLFYDHIMFEYDDFLDLTVGGVTPGEEPAYSFEADVIQLFLSFWF